MIKNIFFVMCLFIFWQSNVMTMEEKEEVQKPEAAEKTVNKKVDFYRFSGFDFNALRHYNGQPSPRFYSPRTEKDQVCCSWDSLSCCLYYCLCLPLCYHCCPHGEDSYKPV